MPFSPPVTSLKAQDVWTNAVYNGFVSYLKTYLSGLTGADLKDPLTLSRPSQSLSGGFNSIFAFKRFMGYSSAVVRPTVRDVGAFGAVGSGLVDDHVAIQAAIDDITDTAVGGVVLIPPGTYRLGAALSLSGTAGTIANVSLIGCGNATVLKAKANLAPIPMIRFHPTDGSTSGCSIQMLRLDGNMANQAANMTAISVGKATNGSLWMVDIENIYGTSISVGSCVSLSVEICRIQGFAGDKKGIVISADYPQTANNVSVFGSTIDEALIGVDMSGANSPRLVTTFIRSGGASSVGVKLRAAGTLSATANAEVFANLIKSMGEGILLENESG